MPDIRIVPGNAIMSFTSSLNFIERITQDPSGSLTLYGSGSVGRTDLFSIDGNNGRLFSVSDDLSDSLFSVNTIAGLPVIEAFADNTVTLGQYGQNVLVITGSRVGIRTNAPQEALHIATGSLLFTSQSENPISVRLSPGGGSANIDNYLDVFTGGSRIVRMGNNPFDVSEYGTGLEVTGRVSLRASALGSAATQILVFNGDPSSTTRGIFTRTPSELRDDIGAGTGNGTVTSIAATGTVNGITLTTSPNPITSTGTITLGGTLGSIANSQLVNSSIQIGTTTMNLGTAYSTITGLSSVTSTTFVGALTGNATTATTATNSTNATVTTSATNSNFKIPFANTTVSTTGNYGLLQDSEAVFTYNPSTNIFTSPTVNATTAYRGGDGSATAPAFSFSGDNNNGMYRITTDTLGFSTAGTARMRIDSSGNVGIGEPTIQGRFHVFQTTNLGGTAGNSLILQSLQNTGGAGGNNVFIKDYAVRDATGTTWTTWRHHNSIDIDGSHNTPGTNTKTWWERDPNAGIHYFGNSASTTLTIDSPSNKIIANNIEVDAGTTGIYSDGGDLAIGDFEGNGYSFSMYSNGNLLLGAGTDYILNYQPVTYTNGIGSGTVNGEIAYWGGGSVTAGQLYFYSSTGNWVLTDADAAVSSSGMLGIARATGTAASVGMLLRGHARFPTNSNYTAVTTIGAPLYISQTPGNFTQTAPTGATRIVRIIGYVQSAANDQIYFSPDTTWVELV